MCASRRYYCMQKGFQQVMKIEVLTFTFKNFRNEIFYCIMEIYFSEMNCWIWQCLAYLTN